MNRLVEPHPVQPALAGATVLVAVWRSGALEFLHRHRRFLATRVIVFSAVGALAALVIWLNLLHGMSDGETALLLATTALGDVAVSVGLLDACDEAWPPTTLGHWRPSCPPRQGLFARREP